jgi:glucose/arabinose dehydrogenase
VVDTLVLRDPDITKQSQPPHTTRRGLLQEPHALCGVLAREPHRAGLKLRAMSAVPRPPSFRRSLMQTSIALLAATALGIAACGGGGGGGDGMFGVERPLDVNQSASTLGRTTLLGAALSSPWGLAFLPDGRMLISEKGGSVALVSADGGTIEARLTGPGNVDATGQGGLLDVALDPDFGSNRYVYFTFAESGTGGTGTAVARGQLNAGYNGWSQAPATIWQQLPKVPNSSVHYGARLAFSGSTLYVTAGERGVEASDGTASTGANGVQNPNNTIGKVVRMNRDGSNPTVVSTGHRNPQGAAIQPGSGDLWIVEHGPQGGDELNRIRSGANYGWPLRSYGCPYTAAGGYACSIGGGTHAPDFVEPAAIWLPTSTAPSGLMFYSGGAFPEWQGSVFAGALAGTTLWRIVIDGNGSATSRQEVAAVRALNARIRDVRQGPDGNIYLLTDGQGLNANRIVRLAP